MSLRRQNGSFMKIVVCIRQGLDGEINPFDAAAYEEALRIEGAEITLLSMGAPSVGDFLIRISRLGANRIILLSDKAFAGADTLATAYTLSLAIKKLSPDYVFCGRQTLIGDTAQTPPMLGEILGCGIISNVMKINSVTGEGIECETREEGVIYSTSPALITVERINHLRLPKLRSKACELEIWGYSDIGADVSRCGLAGSPTRVIKTFENESGKRKCKFITHDELKFAIEEGLSKFRNKVSEVEKGDREYLPTVISVGEAPLSFARTICKSPILLPLTNADEIVKQIKQISPNAVIWGSDVKSKRISSAVAARLGLGLCADCTKLTCEGGELIMYRPALAGSIIAKISSNTRPGMATVRCESNGLSDIIVGVGYGAKDELDKVKAFAKELSADLASSRRLVDNDYMPYKSQVGMTGKSVSPAVYIAIGISGAVHHIAGVEKSGTIIAINPDKNAPIFDYADYGILEKLDEALGK